MSAPTTIVETEKAPSLFWTVIGGLAGFVLFGFLVVLVLKPGRPAPTYETEAGQKRLETRKQVEAAEAKLLLKDTYEWVDQAKGVVRIPLTRAMELEVETLKNKPVRAAYAVPVAPVVSPAPAAPPTPAPTEAKK
jgi:hypothetical protein